MALVPLAKRHKKVKKQPVGARIRTLDEFEQAEAEESSESTALGPVVSARITALGHKSNLIRNIIAAVGLLAMFILLVWLVVLPKLKSIEQPLATTTTPSQNSTPDSLRTDQTSPSVASGTVQPSSPSAGNGVSPSPAEPSKTPSVLPEPTVPLASAEPSLPKPRKFYRVVLGSYTTRAEAAQRLDAVAKEHPELLLQIGHMKTYDSGADLRYVLAVGGVLEAGDAEPLRDRLLKKGLKSASLEHIEK